MFLLNRRLANDDLGSKHAIRHQHNRSSRSHADVFPAQSVLKPWTVVAHAPLHAPVGLSDPAVVFPHNTHLIERTHREASRTIRACVSASRGLPKGDKVHSHEAPAERRSTPIGRLLTLRVQAKRCGTRSTSSPFVIHHLRFGGLRSPATTPFMANRRRSRKSQPPSGPTLPYLMSLPERGVRSTGALAGGLLRELSEVVLPPSFRRTKLYRSLVDTTLRFMIEQVGNVPRASFDDPSSLLISHCAVR